MIKQLIYFLFIFKLLFVHLDQEWHDTWMSMHWII